MPCAANPAHHQPRRTVLTHFILWSNGVLEYISHVTFRKILRALAFTAPVACAASTQALPEGLWPLVGISESLPVSDLNVFDDIATTSKIVALGESVHTSGGYYQAKFRLIKYLVETKGYRLIGMETPWIQALKASEYVSSCTGSPQEASKSLFKIFQDVAVAKMLEWACNFNSAHPQDKVGFIGFDIQESQNGRLLKQFIGTEHLDPSGTTQAQLDRCVGVAYPNDDDFLRSQEGADLQSGKRIVGDKDNELCLQGIQKAETILSVLPETDDHLNLMAAAMAMTAYQGAMYGMSRQDYSAYYNARDDGVMKLLQLRFRTLSADTKAILWAHNGHIQYGEIPPAEQTGNAGATATSYMGQRLREIFGDRYSPIMLTGYHVKFNMPWAPTMDYPEYPTPGALENRLHAYHEPVLFLDLRSPFLSHSKPAVFRDGNTFVPLDRYRALLFLDETLGMNFAR
jgi:erythromycin esterase-like protein